MSAAADIGPLRSAAQGNDSAATSEAIAAASGSLGDLARLSHDAAPDGRRSSPRSRSPSSSTTAPSPRCRRASQLSTLRTSWPCEKCRRCWRRPGAAVIRRPRCAPPHTGPRNSSARWRAIQADCQCVLLVRAAVIGQQLTDVTPVLKQRLGLDRLDVAELRRTLGTTVFAGPREAASQATPSPAMFPNALSLPPPAAPR